MTRIAPTTAVIAAAAALAAGTTGLLSPAHAATSRHQLPGSTPAWANSSHQIGATDGSTPVDFRVYLDWAGGDAAQKFALAVSTPGTADYGKFLTPQQFRSRFAPAQADVNAVKDWLTSQGFKVSGTPANNKYVEATGTVSQAASAFDTSFAQYSVDGKQVRGNNVPLSIPDSLSDVQAVIGLDESQTLAEQNTQTPGPAAFYNAHPCSAYWGEKTVQNTSTPDGTALPDSPSAFAPCGYAGKQLQGAYGMADAIESGNDGTGVTIGVIDAYASPTIEQDVDTYSAKHDLPTFAGGQFSQVVSPGTYNMPTKSPAQDPQGWAGEETLDIEAAHTMAPGANIVYIGAPNNYRDLDAIMNKVVDNHLADIVTNSYGYGGEALPGGYIKPTLDIQAQAAAEGISLLYSSGDNGDETDGISGASPTPDWPASSPLVTAVGGTALGVSKSNGRLFELGWETAKGILTQAKNGSPAWTDPKYQYGSGGGTSRLFAQPAYQAGVVPIGISQTYGGAAMRAVPDVSALGDPTTGMLVGETQTQGDGSQGYSEYRIGGTSLASPLYAGMLALAEQRAGTEFGLANPRLYAARSASNDIVPQPAKNPPYPGAVRVDYANGLDGGDGYVYSERTFDTDKPLTIHVQKGYDDVTGVGSPNGEAWLDAVAGQ